MKIMIQIGVRLMIKSRKERWAALPISILGGSPIKVAVPPILADITPAIRKGKGLFPKVSAISMAMGMIKRTVVTLSRRAERTAVAIERVIKISQALPRANLAAFMATYWKRPVLLVMVTMIIIPINKRRVLKSIYSTQASFRGRMFSINIRAAPVKAAVAR
jgi:hypothetical protein